MELKDSYDQARKSVDDLNEAVRRCGRTFDGTYTARLVNGIAHCISCGQPVRDHRKGFQIRKGA